MNNNLYNYNPINNHYYVDDYLKNNLGKRVKVHVSFSDSIEWRDSVFTGIIDYVGKDFVVIKDNNKKTVIWSIYIDYIIIE